MNDVNLAYCDYYQGVGSCSFGCSDEPECETCEPREGWPMIDIPPYAAFLLNARRLSHRMQRAFAWALTFSKDARLGQELIARGLIDARFTDSGTTFPKSAEVLAKARKTA